MLLPAAGVVAIALLAGPLVRLAAYRVTLARQLDAALDGGELVVRAEAPDRTPQELAAQLARRGLSATVRSPAGDVFVGQPASLGAVPDGTTPGERGGAAAASREVLLDDGSTVVLTATGAATRSRPMLVVDVLLVAVGALLGALAVRESDRGPARRPAGNARRRHRPPLALASLPAAGLSGSAGGPLSIDEVVEPGQTPAAMASALEAARRAEEGARRFLADAAHQLRTPVAGIRACAESLLRGVPGDDRDRLLLSVARESARVGRLVNSLLRLARLDEGYVPTVRPTDVLELCRAEAERVRHLSPGLSVEVKGPGLGGRWLSLDADALAEVLTNLLDNARRHAVFRIVVSVEIGDGTVAIAVADDGAGVPGDDIERIFERFVSLDGGGGSGLGLSIARGLARAQGGDLTCDGRRFRLTLPLAWAPAEKAVAAP